MLSPLTGNVEKYRIIAFDVEGDGSENGFKGGVIWTENGAEHYKSVEGIRNALLHKRNRGTYIFATNLQYDLPIIFQPFGKEWTLTMLGSRLIRAIYRDTAKHAWTFLDALNLAPHYSVERQGKIVGKPKYPTPPYLLESNEEVPEWYCETHNKLWCLECYNARDAEITYLFMRDYQDVVTQLGGNMRHTIASTAMDIFRRAFLDDSYWTPPQSLNELARGAYYGGRVEVFVKGYVQNVNEYDVNSMYPYVMRTFPYPNPNTLNLRIEPRDNRWIENYEGVSFVAIESPQLAIPLLPYRLDNKLRFPLGRWCAAYTHAELRKALMLGYRILKVYWSIFSADVCYPFRNFVDTIYNMRKEMIEKGDTREEYLKIILNSLYGKFGQRANTDAGNLLLVQNMADLEKVQGMTLYDLGEYLYAIKPFNNLHQPQFVNVLWAAYVTAYSRLTLYRYFENLDGTLFYCDTDSIFTDADLPTGTELGELKLKNKLEAAVFLYPKLYEKVTPTGDRFYKIRGIPNKVMKSFWETGKATWEQPTKIKGALRLGTRIGVWTPVTKAMGDIEDKRLVLAPDIDFKREASGTKPFYIDDLIPPDVEKVKEVYLDLA